MKMDWFHSNVDNLRHAGASLTMITPPYLCPKCHNNANLMDVLIHAGCSRCQLEAFNRCRLHVQAIYISDIADPMGTCLDRDLVEGLLWIRSSLQWPLQMRLLKCDCTVWKHLLLKHFAESDRFWTLRHPLGAWFDDEGAHHWQRNGGLTPNLLRCYFHTNSSWVVHKVKSIHKRYIILDPGDPSQATPPSVLIPTCAGAVNTLVVPYREMCHTPGVLTSVLIIPFYEADWHVRDNGDGCFISIQAYTNEIQIQIDTPDATGYLHFCSEHSGYFLLLFGTVVAV